MNGSGRLAHAVSHRTGNPSGLPNRTTHTMNILTITFHETLCIGAAAETPYDSCGSDLLACFEVAEGQAQGRPNPALASEPWCVEQS